MRLAPGRLGGWWRLWIVASLVWAISTPFVVWGASYDTTHVGYVRFSMSDLAAANSGTVPLETKAYGKFASQCVSKINLVPNVRPSSEAWAIAGNEMGADVYCSTSVDVGQFWAGVALLGLAGPLIALLAAYVGRWVYRGFRSDAI